MAKRGDLWRKPAAEQFLVGEGSLERLFPVGSQPHVDIDRLSVGDLVQVVVQVGVKRAVFLGIQRSFALEQSEVVNIGALSIERDIKRSVTSRVVRLVQLVA